MTLSTAGRITLGLLLAAVLAAPVPATAQDKPRQGGELIFVVPSEPPSYDAHEEETFGVIHPMAPHYSTILGGEVPSPLNPPAGCVFHPRCPIAIEQCSQGVPDLREIRPGHLAACIRV